jgi:hypothetical protein
VVGLLMMGIERLEHGTCKSSTSTTSWVWKLKRRHVADILQRSTGYKCEQIFFFTGSTEIQSNDPLTALVCSSLQPEIMWTSAGIASEAFSSTLMVVQVVENDAVGKLFIMKVPKSTASLAKNQANRIFESYQ